MATLTMRYGPGDGYEVTFRLYNGKVEGRYEEIDPWEKRELIEDEPEHSAVIEAIRSLLVAYDYIGEGRPLAAQV